MRRLVSGAVQVTPPIPLETLYLGEQDPSALLRAHLPTDTEVRDAMLKLASDMRDQVAALTAGAEGWTIAEDMRVQLVRLDHGEMAARGYVIIERPD